MTDEIPSLEQDSSIEDTAREFHLLVDPVFRAYEMGYQDGTFYFYGTPLVGPEAIHHALATSFAGKGYHLVIRSDLGEDLLIVTPIIQKPERVWVNIVLAIATVFTTMSAGAMMFGVNIFSDPSQIIKGLPFTLAIMAVLGSHEMGHYLMARKRGMRTSLPYFIPFPSIIGTMGAVIKHRGLIPDRRSLFDVAVAGPLVGLVVSILVTVIGLTLPPVEYPVQQSTFMLDLQVPLLFSFLADLVGAEEEMLHPVAFAGWVGMLITMLNLLPSGQLDGGHVMRAMLGKRAQHVSSFMPLLLAGLAVYVTYVLDENSMIWLFWSFFLFIFAMAGHPRPLNDKDKLDRGRMVLGILTFVLGLLCFTLVPFRVIMN
ncbi:MAG: site-2 protease family protein [Methanosarcinaceae archaeon]|nr:site-2 protease family protein [Methanosarcinaceae archaeon]